MRTTPELAVVADDLSGAAECAAHGLLRVSRRIPLHLVSAHHLASDAARRLTAPGAPDAPDARSRVLVVDTDARVLDPTAAGERVRAASALVGQAPVVVQKIDSLLRGNVATEVDALARGLGRVPVVALANPALGRTVTDGVLHVGGTPVHETRLWAVEPTSAPTSVAGALRPLRTVPVPLDTVRSGVAGLADAFRRAAADGAAPVCDAAEDTDLDLVVAAAEAAFGRTLLVGSGALAAAAIRALTPSEPAVHTAHDTSATLRPDAASAPSRLPADAALDPEPLPRLRSLLMVLGTRAGVVATQLDEVAPLARAQLLVDPGSLLADPASVRRQLAALVPAGVAPDGLAVVALHPAAPADPAASVALVDALADLVTPVVDAFDGVFLAGGQTARAVLDRLGTDALDVVAALGPGTVASLRPAAADAGPATRLVVTRPGSFGTADALRHVAERLLPPAATDSPTPPSRVSATTKENR